MPLYQYCKSVDRLLLCTATEHVETSERGRYVLRAGYVSSRAMWQTHSHSTEKVKPDSVCSRTCCSHAPYIFAYVARAAQAELLRHPSR